MPHPELLLMITPLRCAIMVGQGELRHQERAFQVDVNLQVPFFLAAIERGVGIENAGVVEENVEASEGSYGFVDGAVAFGGLANVGAQEDGLAARFENLRGDRMAALLVAARDRDLGAFLGEEDGSGFADAGSASGDESDFVFQTHMEILSTYVDPDALVRVGERSSPEISERKNLCGALLRWADEDICL